MAENQFEALQTHLNPFEALLTHWNPFERASLDYMIFPSLEKILLDKTETINCMKVVVSY